LIKNFLNWHPFCRINNTIFLDHLPISLYLNRDRMGSLRKNRPQFLKREFRFMFALASAVALLLLPAQHVGSSVIKMPATPPDLVQAYKPEIVLAGSMGMRDSGVEVNQGEYITLLAKGTINVWPSGMSRSTRGTPVTFDVRYPEGYLLGPKRLLLFRLGEKNPVQIYTGPEIIEVREKGKIYLGYRGSEIDNFGNPVKPDFYKDDTGGFDVDILVWKRRDRNAVAKFLEEASSAQPRDTELILIVREFKGRKEVGEAKVVEAPQRTRQVMGSVLKMPASLPDIIKQYKSPALLAGTSGMKDSGIEVNQGDYITLLAMGTINVWPLGMSRGRFSSSPTCDVQYPEGYLLGPKRLLLFRLGEKNPVQIYTGPEIIEVREKGKIYLGYRGSEIDNFGNAVKPDFYKDDTGGFNVDILVWKRKDPDSVGKFFDAVSSAQPKNIALKEMVKELRERQNVQLALEKKTKEVEELMKEISIAKGRKESEIREKEESPPPGPTDKAKPPETKKQTFPIAKKPEKEKTSPTPVKESPGMQDYEKDKRIEELTERLQKTVQALKELEEMKKKLTEREEIEAKLSARLESLEGGKETRNLPAIAVASPQEGMSVDMEYVPLMGVAEHEKGIAKFEISVNNQPVGLKGPRDIQLVAKNPKKIEFSEQIRLREGKNTITITAQGVEGSTQKKTLSIQFARKQEALYAVVVGINKYRNLPHLKYAVNDAREFHRYLIERARIPQSNIWLLLDEEATLEKLRSTLGTALRRRAGKDDTVIIFLASHGATEKDSSSPDGDGLEKYILPYNADPKDLYSSAMPMSEVARIFQRISSERLVFISDTCYSGASGGRTIQAMGKRATISDSFLERLSQGKGRVILTASDTNEISVEKDELKHGVFTYYLLEGLRGKADFDRDGIVTVDEIYQYVSEKVPQATGQDQHPVRKGESKGQIVLGVVK